VTRKGEYYVYPQETWDASRCAAIAKKRSPYAPFRGYIGCSASMPPSYGRVRYNGGCVHDGDWWQGEIRPFPELAAGYKIVHVCSWGWRLIAADDCDCHYRGPQVDYS
jgi:hypothetical protein